MSHSIYEIQQEHSEKLLAEVKARRAARVAQHAAKEVERKAAVAEAQGPAYEDVDEEVAFEATIAELSPAEKEDARRSRRDEQLYAAMLAEAETDF